ncbi:hypothetical protein [Rubritalea tangerina]
MKRLIFLSPSSMSKTLEKNIDVDNPAVSKSTRIITDSNSNHVCR